MSRLHRYYAALLFACLPICATAADEEDGAVPLARGEIIHDYARLTFEWPQPVYFSAETHGDTLSIHFDQDANPDFGALLSQMHPFITHAERESDGKTLVLTLNHPYHIRSFVSGNVSGIDLLNIDEQNDEAELATAKKPAKKIAKAKDFANLSPASGTAKGKPKKTLAVATASAVATQTAEKEGAPVKPETDAAASPPKAPAPAAQGKLKVGLSPAEDSATLRFPFTERVAAAVFIRSHTLWVIFNKPAVLDLSDFDDMPHTVIGKPVLIENSKAIILHWPIEDNINASVAREADNFQWSVLLTTAPRPLGESLKLNIETQPPTPAHVFIPVEEVSDPITVNDPQIGDDIVITPLYEPGKGVSLRREFTEFILPQTAQGIAVIKKADDVTVTELRNGLRVSMPGGAELSSNLPDVTPGAVSNTSASGPTLFPYAQWKGPQEPREERKLIHELFHQVVESNTAEKSNQARLKLAQLYLSEGLAPEAMAMLDGIQRTSPSYYRSAKLAAMHGAANFLMSRYADAARDFAGSELNGNKEVEYWRAMISDLLGNPGQNYDYLALNADYISQYPPLFRQRLAIVAADRMIGAKEYNAALKIFDTLQTAGLIDPVKNYVDFLLAKIAADTGQEAESDTSLVKLAADYDHPFVQARAEFSLIAKGLSKGTLSKDEAINRLERLRLGWHGDSLELSVLTVLGDLYAEKKDYVNAMRVWQAAIVSFPNSSAAIEMAHKMQDAFTALFNEGGADAMSPLDALAVYYEYRNNMASGDAGNQMISHLADRLVAVDLLDQAAALLDHQMHFALEKQQRSEIGAKLATIYLLNRQPQKAIPALEDSVYGDNTESLRLLRNRLTAEALQELDQPDKAIQTLDNDKSPDAEKIRLDIYWKAKDWPKLIAGIEGMLKKRENLTAPVTLDESEYLLKLALAYTFQKDTVQLQYLHDYFGPLMEANPNKPMFDFLTDPQIMLTSTNFDEMIQKLSDTKSFLDNYRARIKDSSLSKVTQ